MNERYFLDQDEDLGWFLILESKRAEWEKWKRFPARALSAKVGRPLEGHPKHVTFEMPYSKEEILSFKPARK